MGQLTSLQSFGGKYLGLTTDSDHKFEKYVKMVERVAMANVYTV